MGLPFSTPLLSALKMSVEDSTMKFLDWAYRIAALMIVLNLGRTQAADHSAEVSSLKGLTDVQVVVEGISQQAEPAGLKASEIRAATEKAIQSAGLRVIGPNERARGTPVVYLNAVVFPASKNSDELYVYSIELSLSQETRLSRLPSVRVQSATWRAAGTIGTTPKAELPKLKTTIEGYVKRFAEDYRAANK
jgi:hypothetical protein